jgi:hypothetical protein
MDIDEYIRLNSEQSSHPELASFVKVWVESRMPGTFNELNEQFKAIEGNLYAHYENESAKNEELF